MSTAGLVRYIATRRFNFIDGVVLSVIPSLILEQSYWTAGIVYVGGIILSLAFEGAARSDRFRSEQ